MKLAFAVLVAVVISIANCNAQPESVVIREYFNRLKSMGYNPQIAPEGYNSDGSPLRVFATMYLIDVHKVDDFSMDYRASLYFRQSWNDSRLAFFDMDISSTVDASPELIWTPDLFFVQEKEGVKHDIISPNVFVKIFPDGEVKYSIRVSVTFSCSMDFRKYPHDIQKCSFAAESYGKNADQLKLDWDPRTKDPVSKTDQINVLSFELTDIEHSASDAHIATATYRRLEINLTFKRKIGFFMTRLYVPFIILVALSWLSFWIKSKLVTLRVSLLLVILYLMINIGLDINTYIPPAPYTKASDIWIAACESLVFAAFLEFLFVSILAKSEKKLFKKRGSSDPEAPIINEHDSKEKSPMSEKMNFSIKMVSCRLARKDKISSRVDVLASILFPVLFIIFNVIYWLIY